MTNKPNLEAIDALIAAGNKATKGKWIDCKEEYGVTDKIMAVTPAREVFVNWVITAYNDDPIINKNDKKYITHAANTRSEIKKLRDAYVYLDQEYQQMAKDAQELYKENLKYKKQHEAWRNQVYLADPLPKITDVQSTELGDACEPVPVANVTDLLDRLAGQAKAIKVLREALDEMIDASGDGSEWEMAARERAEQALEQTKEFDDD